MEKIQTVFILEFSKELLGILNTLEKEYRGKITTNRGAFKDEILERANELTEKLYENYKVRLGLKKEGENIVFENNKRKIKIPSDLFEKYKFFEIKKRIENQIYLIEISGTSWQFFVNDLCNNFLFVEEEIFKLKINDLERIIFYLIFNKQFPNLDINSNVPANSKKLYYTPLFAKWRKNNSFYFNYFKYIKNDPAFIKDHVRKNIIPDYNQWNLSLLFLDNTQKEFDNMNFFPIQTFEDLSGAVLFSIILVSNNDIIKNFKNSIVQNLSITNNFFYMNSYKESKTYFYPTSKSFFDSYIYFLDIINNRDRKILNFVPKYNLEIKFDLKSCKDSKNKDDINQELIHKFNLIFEKYSSYFEDFLFQNSPINPNPYDKLFKLRLTFPEFRLRRNFILKIQKKKNSHFARIIQFLKNWFFQITLYELKDYYYFYGYFLPNFDFNEEKIYIFKLFNELNINFNIYFEKEDYFKSNASFYWLPSSNQFNNETKAWELNTLPLNMNIKNKEDYLMSQINQERKLRY